MLETALTSVVEGFAILTSPTVLVFLTIGMLWGILCGALPGLGNGIAIGVMVSLTYAMDPITAVAFLVSISVGTSFGNGLPAAALGIPGTPSAVLTAIEGYALTKRGLGPLAIGTNWFACVFGQFISVPFFLLMVVPLASITWIFLSPEQFALYFVGMAAIVGLAGKNIWKGLLAAGLGLAIGMVGMDSVTGIPRYVAMPELRGGIPILPAILGLVCVSELMRNMRQVYKWEDLIPTTAMALKFPGFKLLSKSKRSVLMGGTLGTFVGAIPGLSGHAASVIAYNQARITSKKPEEFGRGSIEGLAANEAAQNSAQAGEMVPTLGLGIPGSDSMVLLMGALMLQGFVPGPQLMNVAPQLLYATAAGLIGGALFLLLLGWPIGKLMLRVARIDRQVILPVAIMMTLVGVYAFRRSSFDVFVMIAFGVVGYFMIRHGYPVIATAVALVLGPGFEEQLRAGLLLMDNDVWRFVSRPWTAVFLTLGVLLLVYGVRTSIRERKRLGSPASPDAATVEETVS